MATPTWYVKIDEVAYGPATMDQLRQWYAEGRITADSLVRNGKGMWVLASSLPNLIEPKMPPPPPPAPKAAQQTQEDDWLDAVEKPKLVRKPKKPSRMPHLSGFQWAVLGFLGIVASCLVMITLFYVVLPATIIGGVTRAIAQPAIDAKQFRIVGQVKYHASPIGNGNAYGYRIAVPVKNISSQPLDTFKVYLRYKRVDRPLPDWQGSSYASILGGCKPNETMTAIATAPNSVVELQIYNPGSKLEVSLDGTTWAQGIEGR